MISLPIEDESRLRHIFRDAPGHLPDTPENRALLMVVANDAAAFQGTDRYGNTWHSGLRPDGTQIWVQARGGMVVNGGMNAHPRNYAATTGLARVTPRRRDG